MKSFPNTYWDNSEWQQAIFVFPGGNARILTGWYRID